MLDNAAMEMDGHIANQMPEVDKFELDAATLQTTLQRWAQPAANE
jgi:hypothetical protein